MTEDDKLIDDQMQTIRTLRTEYSNLHEAATKFLKHSQSLAFQNEETFNAFHAFSILVSGTQSDG